MPGRPNGFSSALVGTMRLAVASLAALVMGSGCSNATMSMDEYVIAAEALVTTMEADFEDIESQWTASAPTVEGAVRYWEARVEIRDEFLENLVALTPPESLLPVHETAIGIFERLNAADWDVYESVLGYRSIGEHWEWDHTAEGRAVLAIMDDVYALCWTAQSEFDAVARGLVVTDVPWLPSEITGEVSAVSLRCPSP